MLRYSANECASRIEGAHGQDWYHKFEISLGSGVFTPGKIDTLGYRWRRDFVGLTSEFVTGKRVLDIGAHTGAFSFLMADLGAEVVAVDIFDPHVNGFSLVNDLRKEQIPHYRCSIYDLDPERIGTFDIVAFYGVHYHLRHPLLALERCNELCKEGGLFIGGGTGMDRWFHDDDESCLRGANFAAITKNMVRSDSLMSVESLNELSLCGFAPTQFLRDRSNWFIPNMSCLAAWVESSGFEVTKKHVTTSAIDRDWNTDGRVKRTGLNFVATKTSKPTPEATNRFMVPFKIPTTSEVERLRARIVELEAQISLAG